jgi:hypothetical protein
VDPLNLPEDITILSDEDIDETLAQITDRGTELRERVATGEALTDEEIAEVEALADARDRLSAENEGRDAARSEREARAQSALDRVTGGLLDEDEEGEDLEEEDAEEDETDADDVEEEEAELEEPVPVSVAAAAVPARTRPRAEDALARMQKKRTRPQRPRQNTNRFMQATTHVMHSREGAWLDGPSDVAKAITEKAHAMRYVPDGLRENVYMAHGEKQMTGPALGGDAGKNFGILRDAQAEARHNLQALVASGGCCAPATPLYDFFRVAEAQTPIEDGIPTVPAPRATISYIIPPDWRDALGAIGTRTCAQDAATGTADKPCLHVTCPTTANASVIAVSQCVQFGNLDYRVFPEQVEAFLEDVAVAFALEKETLYLNAISSASTATTAAAKYGASRNLLWNHATAAAMYRKRNAMSRTATIQALFPDWYVDIIKIDMAMDGDEGLEWFDISDAQVIDAYRSKNITLVFYNDLNTAGGQIAAPQGAGALLDWPDTGVSYLYAPGTFARLDAGSLDVGLVRDSVLNGKNDLELFMEEWVNLVMLGLESVKITSTICPNGGAPLASTAFSC